jgi:hypothetical protein
MPSPQKYIKVLFREDYTPTEDIEEIKVERNVITDFKSELEKMRDTMIEIPTNGDWKIGYLPRK